MSRLLLFSTCLLSLPAIASPLAATSAIQWVYLFIVGFVAALKAIVTKNKDATMFAVIVLLVCALIDSSDSKVVLQQNHNTQQNGTSTSSTPIIGLNEARMLIESEKEQVTLIRVSTSPTYDISGLNVFTPEEHEAVNAYAHLNNADTLILISHDLKAAQSLSGKLPLFQENTFIVDASESVSRKQLESYFSNRKMGELPVGSIKESSVSAIGKTVYSALADYNVIKLTDKNILEDGFYLYGRTYDLFTLVLMPDSEWQAFNTTMESRKNIVLFPDGYSSKTKELITSYILGKLSSLTYERERYTELEYTDKSTILSGIGIKPNNSFSNPLNSTSYVELTPSEISVAARRYGGLNLYCFSEICTHSNISMSPPEGVNIVTHSPTFRSGGGILHLNLTSSEPSEEELKYPAIIVTQDKVTEHLGGLIASVANIRGTQVLGATNAHTIESVNYNDWGNLDTALKSIVYYLAPDKAFNVSSLNVIYVAAAITLLMFIPTTFTRIVGLSLFTYLITYHHLWFKGSYIESNTYYYSMIFSIGMGFFSYTIFPNDRRTKLDYLVALTLISTGIYLAYSNFAPPIDSIVFGAVYASLIVCGIKSIRKKSMKLGSKFVGENYSMTSPLIPWHLRGYIFGLDKKFNFFELIQSRKWEIVPNHTEIFEQGAGGFIGYRLATTVSRKDVNHTIEKIQKDCLESGMNKKDFQLWLRPVPCHYIEGSVKSHDLAFNALHVVGEIEDTMDIPTVFALDREKRTHKESFQRAIFEKLKQAEKIHGCAVEIYFEQSSSITSAIRVSRVVKQDLPTNLDSEMLSVWRDKALMSKCSDKHINYSPLASSVLHRLYGGKLIAVEEDTRLIQTGKKNFDLDSAQKALTALKKIGSDLDSLSKKPLENLIKEMALHTSSITEMDTEGEITLDSSMQDFIMDAIGFCKQHGGIPKSFELQSERTEAALIIPSKYNVVKYLLLVATSITMVWVEVNGADFDSSLEHN